MLRTAMKTHRIMPAPHRKAQRPPSQRNRRKLSHWRRQGITEADTIAIAVKQERDDGVSIYNVDIYTADRDYEYDVAVADGTIYSQESEPVERITSTNVNTGVSLDEAKNALLAKVPGAADKNLRISLDRDDGRYNYEGEIITATNLMNMK